MIWVLLAVGGFILGFTFGILSAPWWYSRFFDEMPASDEAQAPYDSIITIMETEEGSRYTRKDWVQ